MMLYFQRQSQTAALPSAQSALVRHILYERPKEKLHGMLSKTQILLPWNVYNGHWSSLLSLGIKQDNFAKNVYMKHSTYPYYILTNSMEGKKNYSLTHSLTRPFS